MEKEFVDWLIRNYSKNQDSIPVGLGDDAAVVRFNSENVVISTDTIADGTHFESSRHRLEMIGHKAIAVSLSDIAAMGAKPVIATVSFVCPPNYRLSHLKSLFEGMWSTAHDHGVAIVGGDTNRWNGKLVVGSTVIGREFEQSVGGFWKMTGGNPGDQIFVSGKLGGSILEKNMLFRPRLHVAKMLATNFVVNAATDITDSLSMDLAALAQQSNCGFCIDAFKIPVAEDASKLSQESKQSPLFHALYDGEDFELIICVSARVAEAISTNRELLKHLTWIGELTAERRFLIKNENGVEPLLIRGFEH